MQRRSRRLGARRRRPPRSRTPLQEPATARSAPAGSVRSLARRRARALPVQLRRKPLPAPAAVRVRAHLSTRRASEQKTTARA